jgi:hypothetical protein
MDELFDLLDKIEGEAQKREGGLRPEICRMYAHTALEICKQKLNGKVDRESMEKIRMIKEYFSICDEIERAASNAIH